MKISPNYRGITDLRENKTNIQKRDRTLRCFLENLSLRMSLKDLDVTQKMFTILLILGVEKIFEKQVAAEKGYTDFDIGD